MKLLGTASNVKIRVSNGLGQDPRQTLHSMPGIKFWKEMSLCVSFPARGSMSNYDLYVWEGEGEEMYRVPPQRGDLPAHREWGQLGCWSSSDPLSGVMFSGTHGAGC